MRNHRVTTGRALLTATTLLALSAAGPAAAQQHAGHATAMPTTGLRGELVRDVEQLEQKYLGLADAMGGKYGWRPGDGVRSVSEVLMHIAAANYMLPMFVGLQPPESVRPASGDMQQIVARMGELEKVDDQAAVREHLQHAFMHARHAIAGVSDAQLDDAVTLFGRPSTKRAVLNLMVNHMHEHLGQSIAYARTNGVVPPWSEGGE